MRLIDADALSVSDMAKIIDYYLSGQCNLTVGLAVELMPTIEPEVQHGRWVPTVIKGFYRCSACNFEQTSNPNQRFCSYCGAKMKGGAGND